ncbi:MAG: substrate-binding domain-containing protein [Leptolinea sp.]
MKNKLFNVFCLLLVVTMLVSSVGCQPAAPAPAPEKPKAEEAKPSEPTKAPAIEPTKPADSVKEAPKEGTPAAMTLEEVEKKFGAVPKPSKPYVFGGIVKTLVNEHWQQVKAGYLDAAKDFGVQVEVIGADSESDLQQQLDFAETLIGKGVNALSVSPLSTTNLNPALKKAADAGIPIINVDDARITDVPTTFFGADHKEMGILAAKYMIERLPAGSEVAMVEGQAGSNAAIMRKDGFESTIKASQLKLVASQPGDWDRVKALDAATNIMQKNPNVKGIYAANDTMALGVIEAVGGSSIKAGIIVVGTDAVPEAIKDVRDGKLDATIAAFPYKLGYYGLSLALRRLEGQALPAEVKAPMSLVNKDNIEELFPAAGQQKEAPKEGTPAAMTLEEVEKKFGAVPKPSKPYVFGGIVKTLVNEHWQQVKAGYLDAAKDFGVQVEVIGADSESDLQQQLDFAETLIGKGVNALSVSPLSTTNLNPALKKAADAGIPIINVDDARITDVPTTFFGADHKEMGILAAKYMIERLPAGSEVAMVEGQAGSNAAIMRKDGFESTIKASQLKLVASQPGDWDRVKALDAATNIMQKNPNVKGIYAANDTMALGVIEAVGGSSIKAGIIVVGTDAVPEAIKDVRDGKLDATIAAFPYKLGYYGLSLALRRLEGQALPAEVKAPMSLVNKDNIKELFPE